MCNKDNKIYTNFKMLTALLIIPLIGSFALLPIAEGTVAGDSRMKRIALATAMVNFIVSIVLWGEFDSSASQYQFVQEFNNLSFCHFHIGVDGISLYFILLTTFITPICILSNWDTIKLGMKYFLIAFLLLETLLIAVFVVLDLMLFYIFFESVLIPLFLIVGIWGGSEHTNSCIIPTIPIHIRRITIYAIRNYGNLLQHWINRLYYDLIIGY